MVYKKSLKLGSISYNMGSPAFVGKTQTITVFCGYLRGKPRKTSILCKGILSTVHRIDPKRSAKILKSYIKDMLKDISSKFCFLSCFSFVQMLMASEFCPLVFCLLVDITLSIHGLCAGNPSHLNEWFTYSSQTACTRPVLAHVHPPGNVNRSIRGLP